LELRFLHKAIRNNLLKYYFSLQFYGLSLYLVISNAELSNAEIFAMSLRCPSWPRFDLVGGFSGFRPLRVSYGKGFRALLNITKLSQLNEETQEGYFEYGNFEFENGNFEKQSEELKWGT